MTRLALDLLGGATRMTCFAPAGWHARVSRAALRGLRPWWMRWRRG